ncbi:MAG: hypothetical protein QHH75_00215 [Bacillota bacterium]|nr:hypothetical protein [Bacillota bacterium]
MGNWKQSGKVLTLAADASGAYQAALAGQAVLVVDVIDMGTTLEAALRSGAHLVLGASPTPCKAPVPVNPRAVGRYAAREARKHKSRIVLIAEPRVGQEEERMVQVAGVLEGLKEEGVEPRGIYPNLGAETVKLVDFGGCIVVAVSACGGTAFDAAFNAGAPVVTGTVARTLGRTGWENAESAVERALRLVEEEKCGLCVVASSSKSLEDVLAAQYFYQRILAGGFVSFRF